MLITVLYNELRKFWWKLLPNPVTVCVCVPRTDLVYAGFVENTENTYDIFVSDTFSGHKIAITNVGEDNCAIFVHKSVLDNMDNFLDISLFEVGLARAIAHHDCGHLNYNLSYGDSQLLSVNTADQKLLQTMGRSENTKPAAGMQGKYIERSIGCYIKSLLNGGYNLAEFRADVGALRYVKKQELLRYHTQAMCEADNPLVRMELMNRIKAINDLKVTIDVIENLNYDTSEYKI